MPYPNMHAARVADPDAFEKESFRSKEIAPGVMMIMGKKNGSDSMMTQAYRFDKSKFTAEEAKKWLKEHDIKHMSFEAAKEMMSIISTLTDKPKIDNGVWIPFMKAGQLAQDDAGKKYRLTKSAIDKYQSFLGGFVNINHQDKISGKITDVKREGEYAYAKFDGLDQEALDVINSPAYRGVSQQSYNLGSIQNNEFIDVTDLQGQGIAIALYPKTPGCLLRDGCGIPLASTISADDDSNNIFSINTSESKEQISTVLNGGTELSMTDTKDVSAEGALKKSTIEMDALKTQIDALKSEIETLKSTVKDKDDQIKKFNETLTSTIKTALEAHDAQLQEKRDYEDAVKGLYSVMKKERADKFMEAKPSLVVIKSTTEALKETVTVPPVGASAGEIKSTVEKVPSVGNWNPYKQQWED